MNLKAVGRLLGIVLLLIAGFLLVPAAVGFGYGETKDAVACLISAGLVAIAGGITAWALRGATVTAEGRPNYFRREGLAIRGRGQMMGFSRGVCGLALLSLVPVVAHGTITVEPETAGLAPPIRPVASCRPL